MISALWDETHRHHTMEASVKRFEAIGSDDKLTPITGLNSFTEVTVWVSLSSAAGVSVSLSHAGRVSNTSLNSSEQGQHRCFSSFRGKDVYTQNLKFVLTFKFLKTLKRLLKNSVMILTSDCLDSNTGSSVLTINTHRECNRKF